MRLLNFSAYLYLQTLLSASQSLAVPQTSFAPSPESLVVGLHFPLIQALTPSLYLSIEGGALRVCTTPQMACFRGSKVCSKWLQERIDHHCIQSDNKFAIGLKVRIQFGTLCLRGDVARLHDRHQ